MRIIERRQKAIGFADSTFAKRMAGSSIFRRGRKGLVRMQDRSLGDSDPPVNEDRQIEDSGGGFKPKKVEGFMTAEPSALPGGNRQRFALSARRERAPQPGGCRRSEGTSVRRERTAQARAFCPLTVLKARLGAFAPALPSKAEALVNFADRACNFCLSYGGNGIIKDTLNLFPCYFKYQALGILPYRNLFS